MGCVQLLVFHSLGSIRQRTSLAWNLQKLKPVVLSVKQKPTGQFLKVLRILGVHLSKFSLSDRERGAVLEQNLEETEDLKEVEAVRVLLQGETLAQLDPACNSEQVELSCQWSCILFASEGDLIRR